MPLQYPAAATDGLMAEPPDFAPGNLLAVSHTGDATDLGYTPDQLSASIISKAAAGLTQMGQWNAATAVATTGATLGAAPTTEPIGGYYETATAGTRYGQSWIVGDRLLVAQTPTGDKVWGKQQALGDIFDAASVYAASSTGVDTQSGTMLRPKKTFTGALAVVAQPGTIELAPGTYGTLGASVSVTKQNVFVVGKGANGSNQCTMSDNLTLNAARFRLRDVNVAGTVTWSDTTGGHQLLGVGGLSNFVFFGGITARGFAIISDCDLTSTLNGTNIFLQNLGAGTATLYLTRTASARLSVGTGWTVIVTDCKDLMITSNAGTVIHSDDLPVIAFLDNQAALTAAINDVSAAANGMYILGFDGATGVMGNPARGDMLYRLAQSAMGLHKKYAWAPATVFGPSGKTYYKSAGYWVDASSIGIGALCYSRLSRDTSQMMNANDRLIFTTEEFRAGSLISSNTSTGAITLSGGQTFELSGVIGGTHSGPTVQFQWFNETSGQWIGSPSAYYSPNTAAAYNVAGGAATAVVNATSNTVVSLRLTSGVNVLAGINFDFVRNQGCWATIRALTSAPAASNPVVHSSTVTIDGMLTAPTKPTVRTVDNITVVDDGSGWCTCTMQLICDSMAGASPGAGVYIFRLPVSAPWFDLNQHPPVTSTSTALSTNAERGRILPGSTGAMIHGVRRALVACAYDGGRFILAVAGHIHSDQWDKVRGDYFEFTSGLAGGGSWLISFRYKKA
jgi:hypothetical protein